MDGHIPTDSATLASFVRPLDDRLSMNVVMRERDLFVVEVEDHIDLWDAIEFRRIKRWDLTPTGLPYVDRHFIDVKLSSTARGEILYALSPSLQNPLNEPQAWPSHPVSVMSTVSGEERNLSLPVRRSGVGAGDIGTHICTFSREGRLVAGTCGSWVFIWSTEPCEHLLDIDVESLVTSAEFTSDGNKLLLEPDDIGCSRILDLQQKSLGRLPPPFSVLSMRPLSSGNFVALSERGHQLILNSEATWYLAIQPFDEYDDIPAASPVTDVWVAIDMDEERFDVWSLHGSKLRKLWGASLDDAAAREDDYTPVMGFTGSGQKLVMKFEEFLGYYSRIYDAATGVILHTVETLMLKCIVPVSRIDEPQMEGRGEMKVESRTRIEDCDKVTQVPADTGSRSR